MVVPLEVFCCYAHKDLEMLKHLEKHLFPLQRQGLITIWSDTNFDAGVEWEKELHARLERADVILLLISPDFMASDYCYSTEMGRAIQRHDQGSVRVVPILLRPALWQNAPFSKFQVLPRDAKPVNSWSDIDEPLLDIANHVQQVVKRIHFDQYLNTIPQLCQKNRYEEALAACKQAFLEATNNDADKASIRLLTGKILFNLKRYEEALTAYEEAVQYNPRITDSHFFRQKGLALQHLKRFREAWMAYDQAVYLGAHDSDLYHNIGTVLDQLAQEAYGMAERTAKDEQDN